MWSEGYMCSQVDNEGMTDALENVLFANDMFDLL